MSTKKVTGISMSSLGLIGILYSAIGIFDANIYRNPLVGVVFLAMILLISGVVITKNTLTENA